MEVVKQLLLNFYEVCIKLRSMKRIILFSILFVCISAIGFTSCKKDVSPTHAEQTANELKAFIQRNAVTRILAMKIGNPFPNQFSASQGLVWSFSNGIMYIDYSGTAVGYNLDYLVDYNISNVLLNNGKSEASLILYFETL